MDIFKCLRAKKSDQISAMKAQGMICGVPSADTNLD